MFYERSQSLVGICKDVGTNSSRTLTLDLTQFDKRKKEEEEKAASKGKNKRKGRMTIPYHINFTEDMIDLRSQTQL
jgi:hypothetical protein